MLAAFANVERLGVFPSHALSFIRGLDGCLRNCPFEWEVVQVLSVLPQCVDVVEGVLGADLVGFHTYNYLCRGKAASVRHASGIRWPCRGATSDPASSVFVALRQRWTTWITKANGPGLVCSLLVPTCGAQIGQRLELLLQSCFARFGRLPDQVRSMLEAMKTEPGIDRFWEDCLSFGSLVRITLAPKEKFAEHLKEYTEQFQGVLVVRRAAGFKN